jgi:hypothetical protein
MGLERMPSDNKWKIVGEFNDNGVITNYMCIHARVSLCDCNIIFHMKSCPTLSEKGDA